MQLKGVLPEVAVPAADAWELFEGGGAGGVDAAKVGGLLLGGVGARDDDVPGGKRRETLNPRP